MTATRVKIRMWRMVRPEKGPGMFVWFDPEREELQLYELKEPPKDEGVLAFSEGDDSESSEVSEIGIECSSPQRSFLF